jgi:hypothetical protein
MASAGQFVVRDVFRPDGTIGAREFAAQLRVSTRELAAATGVSRGPNSKHAQWDAPATQRRLREVVEIIACVEPWAGSLPRAFAWYRAQPLPSFGDQTAEDLVKEGRTAEVKIYLSRIALGGFT